MTTSCVSPDARELAVAVDGAEYQRLLGLPRARTLEGELAERAGAARRFYAERGDPFVAARRIELAEVGAEQVTTREGLRFEGRALAQRVRQADVHALVALAVSAGPTAEAEARRLWAAEKPDESFFLDRFATAIVEHNPYLEDFYRDMKAWAFHSQVFFLSHKLKLHQELLASEEPAVVRTWSDVAPG